MYETYPITFRTNKCQNKPFWRYMDFWKFLNLLETSSLYFSSAESLGDQFEGKFPKEVYEMMKEKDKENGNNFYEFLSTELETIKRKETLISSWCYHDVESFAMWKMYGKNKMGIVIKTDLESLKKSFDKTSRTIYIGEVDYFRKDYFDYNFHSLFYAFLVKQDYYSFENEVRCITTCNENEDKSSKLVEVDLNVLIKSILISPNSKPEFVKLLELLKTTYNLDYKIEYSDIDDSWL